MSIDNEEITKFIYIHERIGCKRTEQDKVPFKTPCVFSATGNYDVMYNSNGNSTFWH